MDDSNNIVTVSPADSSASHLSLPPLDLEDLPPIMQSACANAGWTALTPVQRHALPYMLKREDIMVQSRTGSGKTGAYLLPMLSTLTPQAALPQALVLTPTRELAVQVENEAKRLCAAAKLKVTALYGGVGYEKQLTALRQGAAIVIGTPGRVLDHLMRRSLRLDQIKTLVFDEADRMLSIGFYPDMKQIQRYLPQTPIHATLFSATYPPHVLRLAGEFLKQPTLLSLSGEQIHVAEVQHAFCECSPMEKDRVLLRLIEIENPSSAIIFCNTKANVHFVTAVLQGFGLNADELSADLNQKQREAVLDRLRKGQLRLLVATDVAARGIDIPELSHVFLYEPPEDRESYIHRAGRTGRAGAAGMVISLVDVMQRLELNRIAQFYKIPMTQITEPGEEEADKALGRRVLTLLESRYRELNGLEKERIARLEGLAKMLAENPEHAPLMAMLIDSAYQQCLNPKEVLPSKASPAAPSSLENGRNKRRRRKTKSPQDVQDQPAQDTAAPEQESRKTPDLPEVPAYLAEWIDPEGLDIPEGMEDSLPPSEPAGQSRPHSRRRRRSSPKKQ